MHSGINLLDKEIVSNPDDYSFLLGSAASISMPQKSEWTAQLLGNVYFTPDKGKEPNWFHRKMQELAFGIKWRKK